jgi:hypothetical protein
VKVTTQLHIVLRLRRSGAIPPFSHMFPGVVLKYRDNCTLYTSLCNKLILQNVLKLRFLGIIMK